MSANGPASASAIGATSSVPPLGAALTFTFTSAVRFAAPPPPTPDARNVYDIPSVSVPRSMLSTDPFTPVNAAAASAPVALRSPSTQLQATAQVAGSGPGQSST